MYDLKKNLVICGSPLLDFDWLTDWLIGRPTDY